MSTVAIITNIPAPYRANLFYYMQTHVKEHIFHVIYTGRNEDNRQWTVDRKKLLNSHFLKSKIIKRKGAIYDRYVHLPTGTMKKLTSINPDVVIAFEYNLAALQSLFWCRVHRKKFIHLTDGTLDFESDIGKMQKLSRYLITKQADACIASSTKSKEKLEAWGVLPQKIFISFLTVDTAPFINIQKIPVKGRILYVGHLIKGKGLDLLLQALPYVNAEYTIHIVGNETKQEKKELIVLSRKAGVEKRLCWLGYQEGEALLKEYAEAEVFVFPTRKDCFGLVLLEALCARLPIVSSEHAGGAYDVIEDNKNGYIIDPYDPIIFGEKIQAALEGQLSCQDTESIISKFSFENVTKGYLAAIRYALGGESD